MIETAIMEPQASRRLSPRRVWIARGLAIAADLLQIVVFPAFAAGFASPLDIALDVVMAAVLTLLVGWHIAFIPSFIIKALPIADLAPTWTLAVLFATRNANNPILPVVTPQAEKSDRALPP
jgi:hypothetical protein